VAVGTPAVCVARGWGEEQVALKSGSIQVDDAASRALGVAMRVGSVAAAIDRGLTRSRSRVRGWQLVGLVVAVAAIVAGCAVAGVSGNQLTGISGADLRLLGVNRSGTEYACVQGWGLFDGPNDATSVSTIGSWHVNAVRVPLNEDCWLGINGVSSSFSGANYQNAIVSYVKTLNDANMVAILDLHWNAPGTSSANGQQVMADADHAPAFWSSVATTFKSNSGVIFDLYNEPHDISWSCWRDGCTTSAGWQTAGMQSLVNAVRNAGATKQPIMLGGLGWSSDLSQWLAFEPTDPSNELIASFHLYNFSGCNTQSCWDSTIAPVAAHVPVITGELGENDCAHGFIDSYMSWADAHNISYLGWTWDNWANGCGSGPTLITAYDGTPTAFGAGYQAHLAALAGS
jgi:hypothetical protein